VSSLLLHIWEEKLREDKNYGKKKIGISEGGPNGDPEGVQMGVQKGFQ